MRVDDVLSIENPSVGVRCFTLNRPARRNAISTPLLRSLAEALEAADADDGIRCVIVTGGDEIFAAGADVNEIAPKKAPEGLNDPRVSYWRRLRHIRTPIVAAVEGWCLGAGNELLMCCDIAVASSDAKFSQPETSLGIMPGAGGCATLTRLVGRARAMRMVLTGAPLSAEEALHYGLVAELADPGKARARALQLAETIASRPPLAMQQAKQIVHATFDMPHEAHLAFERQAFSLLFSTKDKQEGIAAFLEKRPPQWAGE